MMVQTVRPTLADPEMLFLDSLFQSPPLLTSHSFTQDPTWPTKYMDLPVNNSFTLLSQLMANNIRPVLPIHPGSDRSSVGCFHASPTTSSRRGGGALVDSF